MATFNVLLFVCFMKGLSPDMEEELYKKHKALRRRWLKVEGWWFKVTARKILDEQNLEATFHFSDSWFDGFKKRHHISIRRQTNVCQRPPQNKKEAIQRFHQRIRMNALSGDHECGHLGKWSLRQIGNVDQTPFFCFTDGPTYANKGEKSVWVRGGASGCEEEHLDSINDTVQLAIFADGEPRIKPLVIFRGKGLRITFREKLE